MIPIRITFKDWSTIDVEVADQMELNDTRANLRELPSFWSFHKDGEFDCMILTEEILMLRVRHEVIQQKAKEKESQAEAC